MVLIKTYAIGVICISGYNLALMPYGTVARSPIDLTMMRYLSTLSILVLYIASAPAGAAGSVDEGYQKAYTCLGCHAAPDLRNAYPTYHVPKIAGQNQAYLASALKAYRNGTRPHTTMQAQAAGLSDQDIEDLASYFAALKR